GCVIANSRFVPRQPESAGKRGQRVRMIINEKKVSFAGQASVLWARESEAAAMVEGVSLLDAETGSRVFTFWPAWRCGSSIRNLVPWPSSLVTEIVPW